MAIREEHNLTVIRKNGTIPFVPFLAIKEKVLGKNYVCTVTFCTPKESQERNKVYRHKDYSTNVLSFPLSKKEGEIYLCLSVAKKEAKNFGMSYQKFLHLLIIHGMLHLKGFDHGSTMEREEKKYCRFFSL